MNIVIDANVIACGCEVAALDRSMDIALVTEDARILREFPNSAIRTNAAPVQRS